MEIISIIGCSNPSGFGDRFCEDENNKEACFFDGGDCCGSHDLMYDQYVFCTDCQCLSDGGSSGENGTCFNQNWVDDDYCDDGNNNQECNYDGGDCCDMFAYDYYCYECLCLSDLVDGTCSHQSWVGDDYCDDVNNHQYCNYDGGDCCGDNVDTEYCDECLCLE